MDGLRLVVLGRGHLGHIHALIVGLMKEVLSIWSVLIQSFLHVVLLFGHPVYC